MAKSHANGMSSQTWRRKSSQCTLDGRQVEIALYGVATVSRLPMERVFWAMLPFFFALPGGVLLLVFVPQIVAFLTTMLIQRHEY